MQRPIEEFLQKAQELVRKLASKQPRPGVPLPCCMAIERLRCSSITWPPSLAPVPCTAGDDDKAELALQIDRAIREQAPAGWQEDADGPRGPVLNALFPLFNRDRTATKAMFEIAKSQQGYL